MGTRTEFTPTPSFFLAAAGPPFERGLCPRKLLGEVRKGGVPPSENELRAMAAAFDPLHRVT